MKRWLLAAALLPALAAPAGAQQTLPPNSVWGRIGAGQSGPAEAIPFTALGSQLLPFIPVPLSPPSPTIYGSAVIQSGLIPTWPTAPITACNVVSGGSGFTSNPTGTLLGGVTHGGSAGGIIALTESGGVVTGCSVTAGGNYSYPPEVYVTGGGGNSALVASVLGNTNAFTTAPGVIVVNGVEVNVPGYLHTYSTSNPADTFCDFINTTTGAYTTQVAGNQTGNFGCTVAPAGNVLLRTVLVTNGQPGARRGTMNGITAIQYFMPMTAGFGYFDTNTVDFPPQSTELPFGNATTTNFPCMMGLFGAHNGGCQFNGQFWLFESSDIQPQPNSNVLDGGPTLEMQRVNYARAGISGDLLFTLDSMGMTAQPAPVFYGIILNRVVNAGTVAHSYGDAQGAWDFYTAGPDNSFAGVTAPRFTIGSGLFPPTFGGYECGQFPAPAGAVALVDEGPSAINLCGNATNNFGNPAGYYLDNNIVLQTNKWTMYGSGGGSNFIASDSNGSLGFGTTAPFGNTGFAKSYVFEGDQNGQTGVHVRNATAQVSTTAGFYAESSTANSSFGIVLHDNVGAPAVLFSAGDGTLSIPIAYQFGSYAWKNPAGTTQWAALSGGALTLGQAGTLAGSLIFDNATSGSLTMQPPTGALGAAVLTLPDVTDTLTANAATQTLTNKSIAGGEINSGLVGASVGGTGVNNGANTLTLGASFTLNGAAQFDIGYYSGAGALSGAAINGLVVASTAANPAAATIDPTLNLSAGTLKCTAASSSQAGCAKVSASSQWANANNTNDFTSASGTSAMAGFGAHCTIVPQSSGTVILDLRYSIQSNTANGSTVNLLQFADASVTAAPAAGTTTLTGGGAGGATFVNIPGNGAGFASNFARVTGLTLGHTYWFDLWVQPQGAWTITIDRPTCIATEE